MEKKVAFLEKEIYISPDIVVVNITSEQNVLASGSIQDMDDADEWV